MVKRLGIYCLIILVFLAWAPFVLRADETGGNEATVTMIVGTARVYAAGSKTGHVLKKGDMLRKEQEVRTADKSRLEIRFPDDTVMRLAERSFLKMNQLSFDKKTENKSVKVELGVGKLWAKVRRLLTADSSVEVRTSNAVAGVRGTVYRVNVEEDKSALVKVYDGTVYVAKPPKEEVKTGEGTTKPHEVSGPHKVTPPFHEVSMEEWTAIVKAMQQISISPQGVPSKPQNFDPQADSDEWVRWNQERDKDMSF
jgi:ferric-dicitrate binding protein FerR (iron transport regulator)